MSSIEFTSNSHSGANTAAAASEKLLGEVRELKPANDGNHTPASIVHISPEALEQLEGRLKVERVYTKVCTPEGEICDEVQDMMGETVLGTHALHVAASVVDHHSMEVANASNKSGEPKIMAPKGVDEVA
jgi:hypothetical protein